jgi:hypothetical protein
VPCFIYMSSNKLWPQRLASAELCAKMIKNFKEALQQQKDIESCLELLKLILQHDYLWCKRIANQLDKDI